jgi:hypothetical protein
MAHRVVKSMSVLVSLGLPQLVMAQAQTYAHQLTLLMPPDPADRQISVVVTPGLASNYGLTDALKLARAALLAGQDVSPADLRALADRNDGLAALRYVRMLLVDPAATPSDIAYYGTIAVATGRVWPLPDAVAAMRLLDPATEPPDRIRAYVHMLYPHAWAGNALALDAVIDLNGEGRLFGALSEETRLKILAQDTANGDGRAVMRMALSLLSQPSRSPAEEALVDDYLTRAAAVDNLAISVTATNILAFRRNPVGITVAAQ